MYHFTQYAYVTCTTTANDLVVGPRSPAVPHQPNVRGSTIVSLKRSAMTVFMSIIFRVITKFLSFIFEQIGDSGTRTSGLRTNDSYVNKQILQSFANFKKSSAVQTTTPSISLVSSISIISTVILQAINSTPSIWATS